ncbi:MAG: WD40/YVTN/BNR-like repeat-containing protein, partial [Terriglobales bacterium]
MRIPALKRAARQSRAGSRAIKWIVLAGLALAAAAQAPSASMFAGMRWRSIGPYRSGNVYNVSGVPQDPTTYYLALPEGGVWKTSDGGTVWKPVFDQEAVPSVGAVAVAASAPATVYVGTGDNSSWSFTPGEGVFKSTDAGASWTNVGLAGSAYIPVVLVDPRNPDVVLVAAEGPRGAAHAEDRGVFRTADGGRSWQHTLAVGAGVADMAWDAAAPSVVFASVQGAGAGKPILYKSSDEGASWQPLAAAGLPALRGATIAVGSQGERVYVLGGGLAGGRATGVYRSDDCGANWRLGTEQIGSAGGRMYLDPQQPDTVYLMGTSLYRSLDGAHSFTPLKGAPGGDDYRALWIDPSNPRRMLAGVDQGPTISVDGGASWTPWYNLPNGQFYDVFTDNQFPYWVYGAQQDSGTAGVRSRSDFGDIRTRDWYPVGGFEAGYIAVDPLNPRWIYTQGWYHVLRRFDRETGQVAVLYTPPADARFTGMPPTVFAPTNPKRLYLAAQYVLASDDGGRDWT